MEVISREGPGAGGTPATGQRKSPHSSLPRRRRSMRPLNSEQSRMVAEHWESARMIALHFRRKYGGFEVDWEGAAAVGICQAAATWRPDGKASFGTHMSRRVQGACLDALRATRLRGYGRTCGYQGAPTVLSLNERVVGDGRPMTHADLMPSGDEPIGWELEAQDEVKSLTKGLPVGHRSAMRFLLLHAATSTQLRTGEATGLSESRISQLYNQALAMIRDSHKEQRMVEEQADGGLGEYVIQFGRERGRTLGQVAITPKGLRYLDWLVGQRWLDQETREAIEDFLAHDSVQRELIAALGG